MMGRWLWIGAVAFVVAGAVPVWPETHVVVLRGVGGTPELEQRFDAWSERLADALAGQCAIPPAQIHCLPENGGADAPLTRERAAEAFSVLAGAVQPDDLVYLVIIGHGSLQQEAKLMVEGPDISAADVGDWLALLPAIRQVILNTTSVSAAFINALSAPGRIVCTSTRSGTERNATEHMEHLLQVLEEGRGDANRDGVLTFAEWVDAAAAATQAWYEREGYIATEHALLDDNGDGQGARLPLELGSSAGGDGLLAAALVVRQDPALLGADPERLAQYREAIARVQALTAAKDAMERDAYWRELEALLLEAARLNPTLASRAPEAVD